MLNQVLFFLFSDLPSCLIVVNLLLLILSLQVLVRIGGLLVSFFLS
jgi:hypothetical protein